MIYYGCEECHLVSPQYLVVPFSQAKRSVTVVGNLPYDIIGRNIPSFRSAMTSALNVLRMLHHTMAHFVVSGGELRG
jgi:hypothetical protein